MPLFTYLFTCKVGPHRAPRESTRLHLLSSLAHLQCGLRKKWLEMLPSSVQFENTSATWSPVEKLDTMSTITTLGSNKSNLPERHRPLDGSTRPTRQNHRWSTSLPVVHSCLPTGWKPYTFLHIFNTGQIRDKLKVQETSQKLSPRTVYKILHASI